MAPLAGHVAHLRHLCKPRIVRDVLMSRHGFTKSDAGERQGLIATHIDQAISFHDSSQQVPFQIKPVLQYYAFLNFAVAVILCYRPNNWNAYRSHGAEDTTRQLKSIEFKKGVVKVGRGAIGLFHEVISSAPLPAGRLSLQTLLSSITMLGHELSHYMQIGRWVVTIEDELQLRPNGDKKEWFSSFHLKGHRQPSDFSGEVPWNQVEDAMPILKSDFKCVNGGIPDEREYLSVQTWSEGNRERALKFHNKHALCLVNFGGQSIQASNHRSRVGSGLEISMIPYLHPVFMWNVVPRVPVLPTLTGALLTSFVLSSVARYRPNLLAKLEGSKLHVLLDVFTREVDGFLIPAMRNLLHREMVYLQACELT